MANLSVKSTPTLQTLPAQSKPVQAQAAEKQTQEAASSLKQDVVQWSTASTGSKIKAATIETFKETAIPYTIGGAIAPPLAGAALGGFIGIFNGDPLGGAKMGLKAGAHFMHYGAAAGLGASAVKSGVVGTVVGTSPTQAAAATRMGTLTAVVGILMAEEPVDLIGVAAETAYDATLAGRIFDKAKARVEGQ